MTLFIDERSQQIVKSKEIQQVGDFLENTGIEGSLVCFHIAKIPIIFRTEKKEVLVKQSQRTDNQRTSLEMFEIAALSQSRRAPLLRLYDYVHK